MARLKIEVSPQSIQVTTTERASKRANVTQSLIAPRVFYVLRDADHLNEMYWSESIARKRARQLYGYSKLGLLPPTTTESEVE